LAGLSQFFAEDGDVHGSETERHFIARANTGATQGWLSIKLEKDPPMALTPPVLYRTVPMAQSTVM
jgi:hypothetical protein